MVGGGWPWDRWDVQEAIFYAVDWWYLTEATLDMDVAVTVRHVNSFGEEITVLSDARGAVDYDPEYARYMLAGAGYPDGFGLLLLVSPDDPSLADMAHMMAEFLEDVGLLVDIEVVPTDDARGWMNEIIAGGNPVMWLSWR